MEGHFLPLSALVCVMGFLNTTRDIAAMENAYQAGRSYAQGKKSSVESAARGTSASTVPGFTTDNPSQSNLTIASIGDAAVQELHRSSGGKAVTESAATRKRFKIDAETDPLLKVGNAIAKNPYTTLDIKLKEGKEEKQEDVKISCEEAGDPVEHACHSHLIIELEVTKPAWVQETWKCRGYDVPNYVTDYEKDEVYGETQYERRYHSNNDPYCRNTGRCMFNYRRIDHPKVLNIKKEEWVDDCAHLEQLTDEGRCQYKEKVCIEPNLTKMIQDKPITKDCWQYRQTYVCEYPSKNNCAPLRAQGCVQQDSRCKEWVGEACVVYEQTYLCPSSKKSLKNIRAGVGSPFCITGNCANTSYKSNGEMLTAMSQMSIFKEMQKDIREGNFEIFKGNDKRCSRNCIDFKDCCQGMKGWGTSLHLASCSDEEKLLAKLKEQKLCHQVGAYCAKKVLGICLSKKTSYCCFGNKLSRIVHEQGRGQLGLDWGSAENPACQGLRPEQLGQLDFSKMDLSELFQDIMASFKMPDVASIQLKTTKQLQENVKHIQSGVKRQPMNQGEEGGL